MVILETIWILQKKQTRTPLLIKLIKSNLEKLLKAAVGSGVTTRFASSPCVFTKQEISDAPLPWQLEPDQMSESLNYSSGSLLPALLNQNHSVLAGPMFSSSLNHPLKAFQLPVYEGKTASSSPSFIPALHKEPVEAGPSLLYLSCFIRGSRIT